MGVARSRLNSGVASRSWAGSHRAPPIAMRMYVEDCVEIGHGRGFGIPCAVQGCLCGSPVFLPPMPELRRLRTLGLAFGEPQCLHRLRQCRTLSGDAGLLHTHLRARGSQAAGEEARREMEAAIVAAPDAAPVIRGTGGIRKLRWAGSGRGKRGGIRTVYFYHAGPETVYLLTAYAKADREDLTPTDTRALSRLVAAIKREATGQ